MKLWIVCAGFVRYFGIYSQKFSSMLNFSIAGIWKFFHSDFGTRKRRIVEWFGSLDRCLRACSRELCESKDRRIMADSPRAIASRRGRQSSGAGRLPRGRSHAANGRDGDGWVFRETCFSVDPFTSLRSAADRTGSGEALGLAAGRKVHLGSRPGAIRDVSWGAADGSVERRTVSIGPGLPKGSPSSRRS